MSSFTQAQQRQLNQAMSSLTQKRYQLFLKLPQDLQKIMFALGTADKIRAIAEKNKLNEDQLTWLSHTVGMILLGATNIVDFVKTLQEKCNLKEEAARQLARDINQVIFLPAKESLKKIHQVSEWPRENEPTEEESPETKKSPLNGNIVNLKNH